MSGRSVLLDSNIIIYLAQKVLMPDHFLKEDDSLFMSDISYMETLGYSFTNAVEKSEIEDLATIIYRLPVSEDIVQKVIQIRQRKKIKLPDAIIAATSIQHGCILATRNLNDFAGIDGLVVFDPFVN